MLNRAWATLIVTASAVLSASAFAQEDNKAQIIHAANEYQHAKEKAQDIKERERTLLANIYKMTQRQRYLASQKAKRLEKREVLDSDISHLQKNIEVATEEISKLKKKVMVRIRNLNRVNAPTIFQSIFGSQDVMEMDRNAKILYKISQADVEQLRVYRGLKNLLDQQQNDLKRKLKEFEDTQRELEQKENSIKLNYQAQMNMLKKLDREDQTMLNRLKRIREKAKSMGPDHAMNDLSAMFEGGVYDQRGKLELPVAGLVTQKFGLLSLMHDKIKIYNKGWFITSPVGKTVSSVYKGRVVYKGPIDDYREVVIVDHGDHFYSVYGNLAKSKLSVGQDIESRENIGEVDQSRFYGPGLYFEIRHFSQSEDPKEWFSDVGINISSLKEQNI